MCEFFIANGADPRYTKENGENAIIAAMYSANVSLEFIKFLVDAGADVNVVAFGPSFNELTPLSMSAIMNRKDLYDYFINVGANPSRVDFNGCRPIDYINGAKYEGSFPIEVYKDDED